MSDRLVALWMLAFNEALYVLTEEEQKMLYLRLEMHRHHARQDEDPAKEAFFAALVRQVEEQRDR